MISPDRFKNKVALVTGAASGIGFCVAQQIAAEGGRVVLADLNKERLDEAVAKIKGVGSGDAVAQVCDVSKEKDVADAVERAIKNFGGLDVIVNNAGLMIFKPLSEHTVEDWNKVLSVDLIGAFLFIRKAFEVMKNGGTIVNVSSIHAVETTPLVCSYAAAKAALLSLTRSAAIEGKEKKIRVNAVLPGAVATPMLFENPNIKSGLEVINQTDVGQPEDIAASILYLASDQSKFVQGEGLRVDGGRLARL